MEVFIIFIAGCPQGESCLHNALIRDGPLENLWGGAHEVQKKFEQGKIEWKKFLQAN